MMKHLIVNVPIFPHKDRIRIFTSDGLELTEYFHIISIDGLKANADMFGT